jgi:hypothetical protein
MVGGMDEYVMPFVATAVGEVQKGLEVRKPRECALALELLGEGKTYKEVEAATGIGYGALVGLRTRHAGTLDVRRKMLAADGFQVAEAMRLLVMRKAEMLAGDEEQLKKVNVKDLMISGAIAQDKAFEALGEAVVKVEHSSKKMTIEDARKMIEEARNQLKKGAIDV